MTESTPAPEPAPEPATVPTSLPAVLAFYGDSFVTDDKRPALLESIAAVNRFVGRRVPAAELADEDVRLGATMLAGRVFKRRLTPTGIEPAAGAESVVFVARSDPQVSQLLRLRRPRVG